MIERIREFLKNIDLLKHLNFEIISEYLGRLSERERYIVVGSILGFLALLVLIIFSSLLSGLNSTEKKISRLNKDLRKIETIRGKFIDIEQEINRLEGIIKRTGTGFSITSYLERLADENEVKITSVSEKTAPPNDLYKERQVEVNLRQIYLENLINFLYKIESSRQLLRIKTLQIKPNYSNPLYLNVVFNVSTFEPVE